MKKYVDLLAVRPMNGGPLDMVLAQSSKAHPGDLVSYDGKMGKVERVAWIGELEGETATLLLEAADVHPAAAIYTEYWRADEND